MLGELKTKRSPIGLLFVLFLLLDSRRSYILRCPKGGTGERIPVGILYTSAKLALGSMSKNARGAFGGAKKKALAKASAFFNEAHLRCMKNEAGLHPLKRAFGTRRG